MICPYCGPDCIVGYGKCHCGCGHATNLNPRMQQYSCYLRGHNMPRTKDANDTYCAYCGEECLVGIGHCHCGCGQSTKRSSRRIIVSGTTYPKGTYCKFVHGHQSRRRCTLEAQLVRMARRHFLTVDIGTTELAQLYGISPAAMSKILNLKSHKDVGIATEEEFARYGERVNEDELGVAAVNEHLSKTSGS